MAELDPIIQEVILQASEFISEMDEVIHTLEDAAKGTADLDALLAHLEADLADAATHAADAAAGFTAMGHSEDEIRNASAEAEAAVSLLGNAVESLRNYMTTGSAMADVYAKSLHDDMAAAAEAAITENALIDITNRLSRAQALGSGAAVAARGGMIAQWWAQWSKVVHWVVMGSLEILATAIPALVAFGAAIFAMEPAFAFAKDRMTALVTASGSLTNALRNSQSPLHDLASNLGGLQKFATGNAFTIMGSAISILTSHLGVFSNMAKQASTVLAGFATKLVADMQGPAGAAVSGFFSSAVKDMVQWGQVLGNIGHTFVNVMHAMFGVSQVLLDAFVGISAALRILTSNPIVAWFIGLLAAVSATYRYVKLLASAFSWLGGTALVSGISSIIGKMAQAVELTGSWGAAVTVLKGEMATMFAPMISAGGFAFLGAITAGLTLWFLASQKVNDNTTSLINKVQSMPPTVMNLSRGIDTLSSALHGAELTQNRLNHTMGPGWKGAVGVHAGEVYKAKADTDQLTAALNKEANQLVQLEIGLAQMGSTTGQVGHDMLVLGIQTDLQDSKVQQLNQAWDQYLGLVTGGTSTLAGFSESIQNIGKVTLTSAQSLKGFNATTGLTARQSANALRNFGSVGAQVWQQFDNTLTGSMGPLADWMKEAETAGVITGPQFAKSILDMASQMTRFARVSVPAQDALVAFAQRSGLPIHNYKQLVSAIKSSGANWNDLTGKVKKASAGMADLNGVAKALSSTLQNQETQAIAAAALKASGFTQDITNMMNAQKANNGVFQGKTVQQWAALAKQAMDRASRSADNAARSIRGIKGAEDGLYNKNITIGVHTLYTTSGTPPGGNAPAPHVGPSAGQGSGGSQGGAIHVHVAGSVVTHQQLTNAIQAGLNQKTVRNGSTQLFIPSRRH